MNTKEIRPTFGQYVIQIDELDKEAEREGRAISWMKTNGIKGGPKGKKQPSGNSRQSLQQQDNRETRYYISTKVKN